MTYAKIAQLAHEVNRAYCQTLGDNSQLAWSDAPEWQKASALSGVTHILSNPDAIPSDSHENWLKDKVADGWVWGPVKDPAKKQHPCMVPYEKLPPEQRAKDLLFVTVVRTAAGLV